MCLLYVTLGVESQSWYFWVNVHGECDVYLYFKLCAVFCWVRCEESACYFVWVENEVVSPSPLIMVCECVYVDGVECFSHV